MSETTSIAIIPARGGSKRLPGKNIRVFFDHPMLAYSIAAALNSQLFHRVIVSTDDPLTGRIAEWYGAEYFPRPKELASDDATLQEVGLQVLRMLTQRGEHPQQLCQLMPNCPLRRSEDILEHYRIFERHQRNFQISVVPYRGVYPQWALVMDHTHCGRFLFGDQYVVRSQELETAYCATGAIWWVNAAEFLVQQVYYGSPYYLAPMDANRGIDIDREEELVLADLLVRGIMARDGVSPLEPIPRAPFPETTA